MPTSEKINQRVQRMKRGTPFSISGFYSLGSRASVEKAMSRLYQKGSIIRVSKGYYVRPKPLKGLPLVCVSTSAERVAHLWAKENGYVLVRQGLETAYRLGLQSQMPVRLIFWSSGPSRQFSIGNETVLVRHCAEKKLLWPGRPEGELFRGLSVLLSESVNLKDIQKAFCRLSLSKKESLHILRKFQNTSLSQIWKKKLHQFEIVLTK